MADLDLDLPSGRLRARTWGDDDAPLLLCGHGLSASLMAFAWLAPQLADVRRVVAIDFRGRGRSDITPRGTYGLHRHARDVLDAASALGAAAVAYAGWSMGALIGLRMLAEPDGARVRSLALIDHAGRMDREATEVVREGLARLDVVAPTKEDYVGAVRSARPVGEWSPFWDDYYDYELVHTDAGWTPSTDRVACAEDLDGILDVAPAELWKRITMPAVLIRAKKPIGGGLIVPADVRDALLAAAPDVRLVETSDDHFSIMEAPETLAAMRSVLV